MYHILLHNCHQRLIVMEEVHQSALMDAQRIAGCLEAAIEKLHILALIGTDGEQGDSSDLLKMRSDETGRLLEQHSSLMTEFKSNIDMRHTLQARKARLAEKRENENRMQVTAGNLAKATKSLTHSLHENVDLQGNVTKIHKIGHQLHQLLAIASGEVIDLHFSTLEDTVGREAQMRATIADTIQREKDLSASVASLRSDLAALRLDMESEVSAKDLALADLKDKLVNQRHDVTIMLSYMSKDSKAHRATSNREWERRIRELKAEIAKTEKELEVEKMSHRAQVDFLEAKIKASDARKLLTIQINEGQTPSELKAAGIEDPVTYAQKKEMLKEQRNEFLRRLFELQDRYDQDVAQRALTVEARRKEREEEAARAAGEQRAVQAAVLLQSSYRCHVARIALDDLQNPKKGKKGKKKK